MPATTKRKKSRAQSPLSAPLNYILGTETNVRVLRALAQTRIPMSRAELSRRVLMDKAGVWRAAENLREIGIIEEVGVGTHQQVRLRRAHPLYEALVRLFAAERGRSEQLVAGIKAAAVMLRTPPKSVWLDPAVPETDPFGDTVTVYLLDTATTVDRSAEELRDRLIELEKDLQLTIEVHGTTLADIASLPATELKKLESVPLVLGAPPLSVLPNRGGTLKKNPRANRPVDHADLDDQALQWAAAIAERLRYDPSLVERARDFIKRRSHHASAAERKELDEWLRVLRTMPRPRLQRFLVEKTERATRLRQTLPFVDALTPDERLDILASWRIRKYE